MKSPDQQTRTSSSGIKMMLAAHTLLNAQSHHSKAGRPTRTMGIRDVHVAKSGRHQVSATFKNFPTDLPVVARSLLKEKTM